MAKHSKSIILTLLSEINIDKWRRLYEESSVASWWQSSRCLEMYRLSPDDFLPFCFGVEYAEVLKGVCIGYVTKSPFYSRRAIILGGPLLHPDSTEEEVSLLLKGVLDHCRKENVIYVETRNFSDYSRWKDAFQSAGFTYQPHYDITIDMADKNEPWRQHIHRSSRANIRKAIAEKETWREAVAETDVREWYELLSRLYREKIHRPLLSYSFIRKAWQERCVRLLVTEENGQITGGTLLTDSRTSFGSMDRKSNMKAIGYEWYKCGRVMATYAGLEWSEEQGLQCYDMMGAGAPGVPYGVRDFKVQMGGELHEYGRYLAVIKPAMYSLGKLWIAIRSKKE